MDEYYHQYVKYKLKYLQLKHGGTLNIEQHPKINFMFKNVKNINFGSRNISAILLPHAGYSYIKNIMDLTFLNIRKSYKYIIILTTNHLDTHNYQPNDDILFGIKVFHLENVEKSYNHFMEEHSYLSILPYIQQFNVPIYLFSIGYFDEKLTNTLKTLIDKDVLLIGNTDLLHCGNHFMVPCPTDIESTNIQIIYDILAKKDIENLDICGKANVKTFVKLCDDYESFLYTSSNLLEESSSSVGYCGIVYKEIVELKYFSYLFSLPKKVLESTKNLLGKRISNVPIKEIRQKLNIHEKLFIRNIEGIFVTIYKNEFLRGCTGTFQLFGDLFDTIIRQSIISALGDTRFNPITEDELDKLSYKINFLKKPISKGKNIKKIASEFEVGKYGLTAKFTDGLEATYLASVLPESFGITQENIKKKIYEVIQSLKEKCGSNGDLKDIQIYECEEFT
jgi:AMMECR1 domain-containing protein/predicted class III extradiol MEMO1 family dioxygenase